MTQKPHQLEDVKLVVEEGEGGYTLIAQEDGGPRLVATGLPHDYAQRIAATWNFCEGFSTPPLQQATLHAFMDAMD